jgi:hypothetical protein
MPLPAFLLPAIRQITTNPPQPWRYNWSYNMGSTVSTNKKIAAFARPNGDIIYIAYEETYSKRDHPHTPRWTAYVIGSYEDVMLFVFKGARSTEGGSLQTRSGYTTPEAYIERWRKEFRAPVPMPDMEIELNLGGSSMYATIEDTHVDRAIAALEQAGRSDLVNALRVGPVTLQLHRDVDVVMALYGPYPKLPLWKILRNGPPQGFVDASLAPTPRNAPVMAPSVQAFRIDAENVLVNIGGAGYEHMGWNYTAVGDYLIDVVLPLELRCDGAAKKMIGAFRDKLDAAPKLPIDTTITVIPGASSHSWAIEIAQELAFELGITKTRETVPERFQVTFAQIQIDATRMRLASDLERAQARWEVPTDPAIAALLPPATPQLYFSQECLF